MKGEKSYAPRCVVLLRHAEKPGDAAVDLEQDGPHLSPHGRARAAALAFHLPETLGRPDVLFAAATSKHSNRPLETITPLAERLGLAVHAKDPDHDFAALAAKILGDEQMSGKLVVVCWHHGKLPQLAAALGVVNPPNPWPPAVFDRFWRIDFGGDGVRFTDLPHQLLFGDSEK
jgi:hypothetical protein